MVGKGRDPRRAARRKRDTRDRSARGGAGRGNTWRSLKKTAARVARSSAAAQSKKKLSADSLGEDGVPMVGVADVFSKAADAEVSASLSEPEGLPDGNSYSR